MRVPRSSSTARATSPWLFRHSGTRPSTAEVFYTRSTDGGQTFAESRPITSNNESQRFEALAFDADGTLFAAWLDKRNRAPAQQRGEKYDGAGLFFASSNDARRNLLRSRMLAADHTCECCRLGLAFAGPGHPVIVFRNIFEGGVRDHAIMTFSDPSTPGEVQRVSKDDWQIAGMSTSRAQSLDLCCRNVPCTWYTERQGSQGPLLCPLARRRQDVFRAACRSAGLIAIRQRPYVIGGPSRHDDGLERIRRREDDGQSDDVRMTTDRPGRSRFASPPPRRHLRSSAAGHATAGKTFLSWMTKADGYRFQPIEDEP